MIKIDRPQFDPNWEARHELARVRFDGLAPTASEPERRAALEALYQAYDAQFPTVAALAEFRFAHLRRSARRDGFMLAIKPLDPQAGEVSGFMAAVEGRFGADGLRSFDRLGKIEGAGARLFDGAVLGQIGKIVQAVRGAERSVAGETMRLNLSQKLGLGSKLKP